MFTVRKILCPFDLSARSSDALRQAGELAQHYGAELVALNVVRPSQPVFGLSPYPGPTASESPIYEREMRRSAEEKLCHALRDVLPSGVKTRAIVRVGQVGEEILRAADDEMCDLIVMEPHTAPGWSRTLFGSTCESVLRASHVPVWLARPAPVAPVMPALISDVGTPLDRFNA